MELSMVRALMSMPTKIRTQDGGCSEKNTDRALTLTTKQVPS